MIALVVVELRAEQPILPLSLFRNRTFVVTVALGAFVGLAMFSAIAFMPTFLQMASGLSAAGAGMLMLPMVGGIIVSIQGTARTIARTGRYKIFVVTGVLVIAATMAWMTTLTGSSDLWIVGSMLFALGAGLGLIMQNIVLAAQNSLSAEHVGVATSTTNYFREVGATLGVAIFGTLFTSRLAENLGGALQANPDQAVAAGITSPDSLVPSAVQAAAEPLRTAVVDSYADAPARSWLTSCRPRAASRRCCSRRSRYRRWREWLPGVRQCGPTVRSGLAKRHWSVRWWWWWWWWWW